MHVKPKFTYLFTSWMDHIRTPKNNGIFCLKSSPTPCREPSHLPSWGGLSSRGDGNLMEVMPECQLQGCFPLLWSCFLSSTMRNADLSWTLWPYGVMMICDTSHSLWSMVIANGLVPVWLDILQSSNTVLGSAQEWLKRNIDIRMFTHKGIAKPWGFCCI